MKRINLNGLKTLIPHLFAAAFLVTMLAGCNTVSGVGKDVEAAGDAIEDSAEAAKR